MGRKFDLEKILLFLIKTGVFFILFLPLVENSQLFFPFIVFKNILFLITIEIVFAAYLVLLSINLSYRPKFNFVAWSVIAFFVVSVFSSFFGIGLNRSFWGNYERMGGVFHHLHLILFFIVLFSVFRNRKDWYNFFSFSVFSSLIVSLIALAQYFQVPFLMSSSDGSRLSGTVGNATFLAAYLLFNLFFIIYFFFKPDKFSTKTIGLGFIILNIFIVISEIFAKLFGSYNWGVLSGLKAPLLEFLLSGRYLLIIFLGLQLLVFLGWYFKNSRYFKLILLTLFFCLDFFVFYNTQTRGAIVGFYIGILILLGAGMFFVSSYLKKRIAVGSLIFLFILPLFIFSFRDSQLVKNNPTLGRISSISLTDLTTESRLLTWKASWEGLIESPQVFLFGVGPENYYYIFNKHFPVEIYKDSGSRVWFDKAHNIIFDVATTVGVIGLIVYLSIYFFAINGLLVMFKNEQSVGEYFLVICLLTAYFIQNLFVFDTLNSEIPFYLLLGFIVFLLINKDTETGDDVNLISSKLNIFYSGLILLIMLVMIFGYNIRTLNANHQLYLALSTVQKTNLRLESFRKSINLSTTGLFEARQQLYNFDLYLLQNKIGSPDDRKQFNDYTIEQLQSSIKIEPKNVSTYMWLGALYNNASQLNAKYPKLAVEVLSQASELSPTRPQIYFELGRSYALSGDIEKTIYLYKKAVNLAPWVLESHWQMVGLGIVLNQEDLVNQQLTEMKGLGWQPSIGDYQRMISSYQGVKNYGKIVELYNKIIAISPSSSSYKELANIYAKMGNNEAAKKAMQQAVAINQNLESEADDFYKALKSGELLDK